MDANEMIRELEKVKDTSPDIIIQFGEDEPIVIGSVNFDKDRNVVYLGMY